MRALASLVLLLLGGCDVYDTSDLLDASTPVDGAVEACWTTMCNGTCTDTQTDKNNCGACGQTCEVSCTAGLCTPTQLGQNLGAPHGIVINGSSLYVAEFGGINVFVLSKIDGTGFKNFATGQLFPDRLVTDGTTLFWTDLANISSDPGGAVEEEAFSGAYCNAMTMSTYCWLANKLPSPYGIAMQGTTLFFTTTASMNVGCPGMWASAVLSCSTLGCAAIPDCNTSGGPTVLASNQTQLAGIAADAKNIYWADSGAHVIRFCPQPRVHGRPSDLRAEPRDAVRHRVEWNDGLLHGPQDGHPLLVPHDGVRSEPDRPRERPCGPAPHRARHEVDLRDALRRRLHHLVLAPGLRWRRDHPRHEPQRPVRHRLGRHVHLLDRRG